MPFDFHVRLAQPFVRSEWYSSWPFTQATLTGSPRDRGTLHRLDFGFFVIDWSTVRA